MASTQRDGSIDSQTTQPAARGNSWAPLLVALVAPVLILQVAVVRPATVQLARMRGQVARLEATVEKLQKRETSVRRATGLLVDLAEQDSRIAAAEAAFDRIADLERRIAHGVATTDHAAAALDRLDSVVSRLQAQSRLLAVAEESLTSVASVPARLHSAIDRAGRLAPTVAEAKRLATRLGEARVMADEAADRADLLLERHAALALSTGRLEAAHATLDGLVQLESRLNAPLMAVEASHERLDELVRLKDAVLTQTDNLPEAFETFELIVDLQADYQRARGVFRTVQRLMADMVLLEPSISRIAAVIDPMINRTSIAALGGGELRLVLRELRDRRAVALAEIEAQQTNPGDEASVASRSEGEPERK